MKSNFLLIFFVAIVAYVTLSSRSGGAGTVGNLEKSGIPGTGTCADCHSGGTFNPTTSISFKNSQGLAVTQVYADSTYDVTVTIAAASGNPSRYGFQGIMVSDSANQNCGTFINLGAGQTTKTFSNGRVAVEQNTPSSANNFSFKWKAPSYIPGNNIRLYVSGLAVNGNSTTSGDANNSTSIQLSEAFVTPTSVQVFNKLELDIYPNPTVSVLNLDFFNNESSELAVNIISIDGKVVLNESFNIVSGENRISLNVENLNSGLYLLTTQDLNGAKSSRSFVKY
jgi:hypothetical protein